MKEMGADETGSIAGDVSKMITENLEEKGYIS
jgi:hypothetical protein